MDTGELHSPTSVQELEDCYLYYIRVDVQSPLLEKKFQALY